VRTTASNHDFTHANGEFIVTDSSGDQVHFFDFTGAPNNPQWGKFKSVYDPDGIVTTVTSWTSDGRQAEVQRSTPAGQTPAVTESYVYSYLPSTDLNPGLLSSVTLRRGPTPSGPWTTVRQVTYDYYDGTSGKPGGNLGDLRTATILDANNNVLETKYYRYWPRVASFDGLKYVFNGPSYARLAGAVANPLTASDSVVAPYADYAFTYDALRRVTTEVAQGYGSSSSSGGLGTYQFSYSTNPQAPATGFNTWSNKTIETLPDGNSNIVYTNAYGEVMLKVNHNQTTGQEWLSFHKYDSAGRQILKASPSAVSGYNANYADLLDQNQPGDYGYLNGNSGLIELTDYYTTTTATPTTPGGVTGYIQDTKVQQGKLGTPVLQDSKQYYAHPAPPVDVQVGTPGATSAITASDQFTYTAAPVPVVTGVGAAAGTTNGGYYLYLAGSGFTGAASVTFGGTPGTTLTVYSDNALRITVPAHAAGVVDVQVTGPGGNSAVTAADQFTYVTTSPSSGPPAVTGVGPITGTTLGGYSVYVTGSGFTGATAVSFGGLAGSSLSVIADNLVQITAPAHASGTVDIQVTTPSGTSAITSADHFSYTAAAVPVITGVGPVSGTTAGGTVVYVVGSGLTGASAVSFGGAAGSSLTVLSDTALNLTTPAHAAGVVDVQVTTPAGTSALTSADRFTYTPPAVPVITGVGPATGTTLGGYYINLTGTGFTGASAISFGGTASGYWYLYSDTAVQVLVPAHAAGVVDIQVTTAAGTSTLTSADRFTYALPPVPVVTGVGPVTGTTLGGYYINLTGSGFTGATAVTFGGAPSGYWYRYSDTALQVTVPAHAAGAVDIQVTTPGGTSATSAADRFTYVAPPVPVITGVGSTTGTTLGGYSIYLTGTGFTAVSAVSFGGTASGSWYAYSDSALQVTVPAHASGTVDIQVTTPGGTSAITSADQFTYVAPPVPVITGVGPPSGTTAGGYTVSVVGRGFTGASAVSFGGTAGTSLYIISDTTLQITAPAHGAGVVDVQITTPGGTSAVTAADQFTYVTTAPSSGPPTVTGVGPVTGTTLGGYYVYVTGSGFTGATAVTFGSTAGSYLWFYSDSLVRITAPAHAAGVVDVKVTASGVTSAVTAADQFTFVAPPVPAVTGVGPASGKTLGGFTIYVAGSGFTGASSVSFGGSAGSYLSVLSDNLLQINPPAHAAGVVDVQVTTPGGTSPVTTADQFTYVVPPVPVVTGAGPTSGTTLGGYAIYVAGSGFTAASGVVFGGMLGSYLSVLSDNLLQINPPAHAAGVVDIQVTTPGGTSTTTAADQFTYVVPPVPTVTGVGPASGTTAGGFYVYLTGTGFTGATAASFGGVPGSSLIFYSDNLVRILAPAHAGGVVDVQVTTPGGTSPAATADQFTYLAPTVTVIAPPTGTTLGGYSVYLLGSNFTGASTATFGGIAGTGLTVYSDNALRISAPPASLLAVYPVATSTVYPVATNNLNDPSALTTSTSYTWFPGVMRIQAQTTSQPVVSTAHNGPGTADVDTAFFDIYGRPIWTKDADGYIDYTEYDPATGAVTKSITDVDTTKTGDFNAATLPSGWTTRAGGGLHLITLYQVDGLGRTTKLTDPNGNVTYRVYKDSNHEVRTYAGWQASTNLPTGPTIITRLDYSHSNEDSVYSPSYTETLTISKAPNLTNGQPDGSETFTMSDVQSLRRAYVSQGGQLYRTDEYFNPTGLTYATDLYIGTAGTNYYPTLYGFDPRGRLYHIVSPTGTITVTDYDGLGRVADVKVGTSDSNLVMTTQYQYDQGGIGDGDLTQVIDFPGGSAAQRTTLNYYDWRDRLVETKQGAQASENDGTHRPILYYQLDNLGNVFSIQQYDGDGVTITSTAGVPNPPSASLLRAQTTTEFDEQGRVYQTNTYSVDQTAGTVSANSLTTNTWYDHRGDVIKTSRPGGLVTKMVTDGAGRETTVYQTDGAGDSTWSDASSVANNNVLTETDTQYDKDGNPILVIDKERFHNETATGALGNPSTSPKARDSYTANYFDAAQRLTDQVDVGTNGGTAYARPATVPAGSATVLVTHTAYNAAGLVQAVTDPRGIVRRTSYDLLGRTTQAVQDYTGGPLSNSSDQTTQYTYDGDGHVLTMTALLPGSSETTQYTYGVTTASSGLNSNDLLASVTYPANGQPNTESYTYNGLGEVTSFSDRNGNTHWRPARPNRR
jgi:YD repeat-containing protein